MSRWIDSHCHLQDQYRPEGDEVLGVRVEASGAGVRRGGVRRHGRRDVGRQAVDLVRAIRSGIVSGAGDTGADSAR